MSCIDVIARGDLGMAVGKRVFGSEAFAVASMKVLAEAVGLPGVELRGWWVWAISSRALRWCRHRPMRVGASGVWRAGRAASGVLLRGRKPRGGLEVLCSAVFARARMWS